ncbi:PRC-barrel domain-containing protein, partial [Patescibacteria group bacterium]|nr:PRC-barrel domain-containing protein [Patescibacteria group bacterium]
MQYFSELSGKKVFTQDKNYIGKVTDLLFLPNETPLVTKFIVKTPKGNTVIISDQEVRKNGIGFIVNNNYKQENKAENEVSLLNKL